MSSTGSPIKPLGFVVWSLKIMARWWSVHIRWMLDITASICGWSFWSRPLKALVSVSTTTSRYSCLMISSNSRVIPSSCSGAQVRSKVMLASRGFHASESCPAACVDHLRGRYIRRSQVQLFDRRISLLCLWRVRHLHG